MGHTQLDPWAASHMGWRRMQPCGQVKPPTQASTAVRFSHADWPLLKLMAIEVFTGPRVACLGYSEPLDSIPCDMFCIFSARSLSSPKRTAYRKAEVRIPAGRAAANDTGAYCRSNLSHIQILLLCICICLSWHACFQHRNQNCRVGTKSLCR